MADSQQDPPSPPPGPPFIPSEFAQKDNDFDTTGYVLNHVALQVSSATSSLSFYVDLLGMSLIFALNAGPMTAYYLGYRDAERDAVPADMARTSGTRSGLLELIVANDETFEHDNSTPNEIEKKVGTGSVTRKPSHGAGFAHLGFRVPDVAAILKRAEEKGWKVMKPLGKTDIEFMPLPGWDHETQKGEKRKWDGGFEKIFAQVAFLQDPDGNWIEILPREMKRG